MKKTYFPILISLISIVFLLICFCNLIYCKALNNIENNRFFSFAPALSILVNDTCVGTQDCEAHDVVLTARVLGTCALPAINWY